VSLLEPDDAPRDPAAGELTAEVAGVRWSVPDGDFAVLDAVTEDGDEIVLVGPLGHVRGGESTRPPGSRGRLSNGVKTAVGSRGQRTILMSREVGRLGGVQPRYAGKRQ